VRPASTFCPEDLRQSSRLKISTGVNHVLRLVCCSDTNLSRPRAIASFYPKIRLYRDHVLSSPVLRLRQDWLMCCASTLAPIRIVQSTERVCPAPLTVPKCLSERRSISFFSCLKTTHGGFNVLRLVPCFYAISSKHRCMPGSTISTIPKSPSQPAMCPASLLWITLAKQIACLRFFYCSKNPIPLIHVLWLFYPRFKQPTCVESILLY
jgi:hypothetical protein